MNGMGICNRLEKLLDLLAHLKGLLKPGGQILADSSDLIYMFEQEDEDADQPNPEYELPADHYYGEVIFRTFYKDLAGDERDSPDLPTRLRNMQDSPNRGTDPSHLWRRDDRSS